ncbi:hypothetical protein P7K49_036720 [Saguinus oedipus]|uniref:Uncharacterized protein n=1 Tax=Saguinus oedipus TaxID=9490 RepID=A0ABQ9TLL8_SAGOE|nr:hypothetical protein P7K49_036720 [Saguinus oedipus]
MNPEKDFAPLTPNIVRALNDKLYEKRKVAALEIEKLQMPSKSLNVGSYLCSVEEERAYHERNFILAHLHGGFSCLFQFSRAQMTEPVLHKVFR